MLVFNEGVPGSGKSYDAVSTHILVALAAGRRVFARLNGLNRPLIAAYIGVTEQRIDELLFDVETADVVEFLSAKLDAFKQWSIPDVLKDALVVIDEAHEFYVASREAIDPRIEQFFALHRHYGIDVLLMSQWYRRLHSSVRARIERKNVFQKMTAVGMDAKYTLKMYHATAPDRFELVDTTINAYNPKIFPLYRGYAPVASNVAVYKAGGVTVWRKLGKYGLVMAVILVFGIFALLHFLRHPDGMLRKQPEHGVQSSVSLSPSKVVAPVASAATGLSSGSFVRSYDEKGMPDEAKYVFDLCAQARPRLAAVLSMHGQVPLGIVEWPQEQHGVLDRMTFDQLRDLGVVVEVHRYGVKLRWRSQSVIVTSWPLEEKPDDQHRSNSDASRDGAQIASSTDVAGQGGDQPSGAGWKTSPMRDDYVPPELVPHSARLASGTGM